MARIKLEKIDKIYRDGVRAIHDLSFEIKDGEFMVLVGPSGCGKSTTLRMIAGLESISKGELKIGDKVVNNVDPKDRDIAMVFQSYALYPHKTVRENIAFPLQMAGIEKAEIDRRVNETVRILDLTQHLDRKPANLSGGQRQRVAMGRAMVRKPTAFLMDEPLSNLDSKLRVQMRAEIARLQRELRVTTLYVTHDQVEAMTMGDRVAVLKGGILQQVDTPHNLYHRPANAFVGAFIGSPSMNLYEGILDGEQLKLGDQKLTMPRAVFEQRPTLRNSSHRRVIVGIRPEDMEDAATLPQPAEATLKAQVKFVERLGAEAVVHLFIDAPSVDSGDPDAITDLGDSKSAVARFSSKTSLVMGDTAVVAVTLENVYFFDPQTHTAIGEN
jgi:multiple sugar transport system ATP-binding protein